MRLIDLEGINWSELPTDSGYIHKDDLIEWLSEQPTQIAIPISTTTDDTARVFGMETAAHVSCAFASYGRMLLRILQAERDETKRKGTSDARTDRT